MSKTSSSERRDIRAYWRKKFLGDWLIWVAIGSAISLFSILLFPSPDNVRSFFAALARWAGAWAFLMTVFMYIIGYFQIRKKVKSQGMTMAVFVRLPKNEKQEIEMGW